jgi:hypothetical protein
MDVGAAVRGETVVVYVIHSTSRKDSFDGFYRRNDSIFLPNGDGGISQIVAQLTQSAVGYAHAPFGKHVHKIAFS